MCDNCEKESPRHVVPATTRHVHRKPVDEDLYKISPDLLYTKSKMVHLFLFFNFFFQSVYIDYTLIIRILITYFQVNCIHKLFKCLLTSGGVIDFFGQSWTKFKLETYSYDSLFGLLYSNIIKVLINVVEISHFESALNLL